MICSEGAGEWQRPSHSTEPQISSEISCGCATAGGTRIVLSASWWIIFSAYELKLPIHIYIYIATAAALYNCGHYCSFCLCSLECLRELCTCCLMRFIWPASSRWAEIKGGGSGHWHDLQHVVYGEHPSSDVWQVWGQWLVSISSVKNGESNSSWWCMFLDLD